MQTCTRPSRFSAWNIVKLGMGLGTRLWPTSSMAWHLGILFLPENWPIIMNSVLAYQLVTYIKYAWDRTCYTASLTGALLLTPKAGNLITSCFSSACWWWSINMAFLSNFSQRWVINSLSLSLSFLSLCSLFFIMLILSLSHSIFAFQLVIDSLWRKSKNHWGRHCWFFL